MKRSIFGSGFSHPVESTGADPAAGFASSGAGESAPESNNVASVRCVRLRGIHGMIRPSQNIGLGLKHGEKAEIHPFRSECHRFTRVACPLYCRAETIGSA